MGNALYSEEIVDQLHKGKNLHDEIVNVHIDWAIEQQLNQLQRSN